MMDRDGRGLENCVARGEILRLAQVWLMRKRLPSTFSLIKNESWGIEDD